MSIGEHLPLVQARSDYAMARRAAKRRRLWARLLGKSNTLIPFEDLKRMSGFVSQRYRGLQPVALDKIIGSLERFEDFDRTFQPTQEHSARKWLSVDSAYIEGVSLPAISLYKVGDAYFVVDGHHRVSGARQKGQTYIDAEVIEVKSRVPVTANLTLQDLDVVGAYRDFLEETGLDELRPDQNVRLTMPGDYSKLIDHIRTHKYFVETDGSRELTWEEAVTHWYDQIYLPVVETIRKNNLMADFPGHADGDLYLWLIEHAYYLSQELGQNLAPWEVARDYINRFSHRPKRLISRIKRRLFRAVVPDELGAGPPPGTWRETRVEPNGTSHLFRDVLIAVTGAPTGWQSLSQAAEIAHREHSVLHGLHVLPVSCTEDAIQRGQEVLEKFTRQCEALKIKSTASLLYGDVADKIVERARWVDLVVINQRRVHGQWSERPLGTIFQTVASQAAQNILAVPGSKVTPLDHILLAYDGSPKSQEALFIFRHLITCWKATGVVLTVGGKQAGQDLLDSAQQYLQEGGCPDITMRRERGVASDVIVRAMGEEKADLLLMGGYGHQPLLKAVMGSTVDRVLRVAWFPVLICR